MLKTIEVEVEVSEGDEIESYEFRLHSRTPTARLYELKVKYRPAWEWPDWLSDNVAAIAMSKDGMWFTYSAVPKQCKNGWSTKSVLSCLSSVAKSIDLGLPVFEDWKCSLITKPGDES